MNRSLVALGVMWVIAALGLRWWTMILSDERTRPLKPAHLLEQSAVYADHSQHATASRPAARRFSASKIPALADKTQTRSHLPAPNIRLWGTSIAEDPAQSVAIIEENGKNVLRPWRAGMQIQGWQLARIDRGIITLADGDTTLQVRLTDQQPAEDGFRATASQPLPPKRWLSEQEQETLKAAIEVSSETERVVDRQKVSQALKQHHPLQVVREAGLRPAFSNGQLVGVKFESIPEDGVLRQSGFQAGDIVREVNGQPVTNPAVAFQLSSQIAQQGDITVVVERNGHPTTLTYHMR